VKRTSYSRLALTAAGIGAGMAWINRRRRTGISGKNVVITGGSRGLGLALAREFLQKGNRVALLARDPQELERAKQSLPNPENVLTVECDVTNKEQVNAAFDQVELQWGAIDVLVNNAGTITVGPMDLMEEEDYRESLNTYFWAPFYSVFAALPRMQAKGSGRIVNISSIGGKISVPHLLPYSVGKFALAGFSEGLRSELLKEGIVVTTVYPGLMRTGSPMNAKFKGKHHAEYTWFSLSDSLPGLSISADRAARQIVRACEASRARLIISLPAKFAIKVNELLPEVTAAVLAKANRLLPGRGGIGSNRALGKDSHTSLSPSLLTVLGEKAAVRNNQTA
jgi:NAD(P)-dependent dehydrogenase (short-subunit alcohol dehydrogenase family)